MKRFLIFGITDCSDMTAGARGYLGQFETFEELVDILKNKKQHILSENINSFNVLDLEHEEILLDGVSDAWELIDFNDNRMDYKLDNYELCKLRKSILKRTKPVLLINEVSKDYIPEYSKELADHITEFINNMKDYAIRENNLKD